VSVEKTLDEFESILPADRLAIPLPFASYAGLPEVF